jgi:hypothetical protein
VKAIAVESMCERLDELGFPRVHIERIVTGSYTVSISAHSGHIDYTTDQATLTRALAAAVVWAEGEQPT